MSRALGLLAGFLADRVVPDPARFHPVAGFGTLAAALERRIYAPTRARGVAFTATLVGGTVVTGAMLQRRSPLLATALATWVVLGGSSLEREARAVSDLLAADRLADARERLTHLVGRDTSSLDEGEITRAVIESVAENTSDAVVAPLLVGAVLGVPGLLGYRAANTLDAMVGHRNERYSDFGWASARLDDVLNLPGSRLTALLAALLGPSPRDAFVAWRRDASPTPPPTPARSRPPSPEPWGSGSAGPTPTATTSSTAPSSAPADRPSPRTSAARSTWRDASTWRPSSSARPWPSAAATPRWSSSNHTPGGRAASEPGSKRLSTFSNMLSKLSVQTPSISSWTPPRPSPPPR